MRDETISIIYHKKKTNEKTLSIFINQNYTIIPSPSSSRIRFRICSMNKECFLYAKSTS